RERQQKWIEAALAELRKASTLENGLMAAKAMFAVGVCYIMLDERGLALTWFEHAYQAGQQMESKLVKKSTLSKMDAATIISLPLTTIYGAAWLGYRKYQRNKVRQLVLQLRDFMIFATNVLHAYQSKLDTLQTAEQRAQNYLFLLSFLSNNGTQVTPNPASLSRSFANVGAIVTSVGQRVSSNVPVMPLPSWQVSQQHMQAPAQRAMPIQGCLHFHRGGQVSLAASRTFIGCFDHRAGSQHDIDLTSAPEAYSVSPMHARIECTQGRYTITDLGSQYATCVNNQRLIPNYPFALKHGDVLNIGKVRCTFIHVQ
ncbi:MAG: FHA domain-containing protein, partial [Ktedonobacteraceae bacterium]